MGIERIAPVLLLIAGLAFALATGWWSAREEHERERTEGTVA
ncbi:MAG: hypothetical protein V3S31_01830 [Dehalococcoidia bacterium]